MILTLEFGFKFIVSFWLIKMPPNLKFSQVLKEILNFLIQRPRQMAANYPCRHMLSSDPEPKSLKNRQPYKIHRVKQGRILLTFV